MNSSELKKILEKNPLARTRQINIEISTICNNSQIHRFCPLYCMERKVMSLSLIEKILIEIGKYDYSKKIAPFSYSEPTADPRLYVVLNMIRKYVPKAKVYLISNGFFIDDVSMKELLDRGVQKVKFSCYTQQDFKRISEVVKKQDRGNLRAVKMFPTENRMDSRVDWYDTSRKNLIMSCAAPLHRMLINVNGDLTLCCLDWKYQHTFGSLKEKSLKELITSDRVIDTYLGLLKGKRTLDLCSRCNRRR